VRAALSRSTTSGGIVAIGFLQTILVAERLREVSALGTSAPVSVDREKGPTSWRAGHLTYDGVKIAGSGFKGSTYGN
jgi:hypothetical protein